jgi:hypothetical protein
MKQLEKAEAGGNERLKAYFEQLLRMQQQEGGQFPADFDEVWPMAYAERKHAVQALAQRGSLFVQGIDYQISLQNAEKTSWGAGRPLEKYHLTVRALEWFVARRVPAVFDIYRAVFWAAAGGGLPAAAHAELEKYAGPCLLHGGERHYPLAAAAPLAGVGARSGRLRGVPALMAYGRRWITAGAYSRLEAEARRDGLRPAPAPAGKIGAGKQEQAKTKKVLWEQYMPR